MAEDYDRELAAAVRAEGDRLRLEFDAKEKALIRELQAARAEIAMAKELLGQAAQTMRAQLPVLGGRPCPRCGGSGRQ